MTRLKTLSLFLLFLIAQIACTGQINTGFVFQKDDTLLRNNYYNQSVKKKEQLIAALGKDHPKDYKKIYDEQFDEISKLWLSTRPVTYAEAHSYLQAIVKKIIAANDELKDNDARIVFSRDWWPNAVSMGDGSIAINAGLMVYMNNEAELVFVICHELAHYYLQHTPKAIKKYIETVTSEDYQSELKRLSKTTYGANKQLEALGKNVMFNNRRHSRDNEAAADYQAFLFMKKTGYDCGAIITSLKLLDKVDDSLLYKRLDLQQAFNADDFPFKRKWIQKESSIFSQADESTAVSAKEKDSLKTHPDCKKRIALLADSIRQLTSVPGKKFQVDEKIFNKLRKDFAIEISEECYREKKLSRNLYFSLLLMQANEHTPLQIFSVARCLNEIYLQQKEHKLGLMIDAEDKTYPEEYNLLLRMLSRIRLDELAALNYSFCNQHYALMKSYPGFETEMGIARKNKTE